MKNNFKIGDGIICKNNIHPVAGNTIKFNINKTYLIVDIDPSVLGSRCINVLGEEEGYFIQFTIKPDRDGLSYETFFHKLGSRSLLMEKL